MKIRIYAIVPAESPTEAIEAGHNAFTELCPGGSVPIFDRYRMWTTIDGDGPGVYPVSEPDILDRATMVWEETTERLNEIEPGDSVYGPETAARARLYRLYDDAARPILSRPHFTRLVNQDDRWLVAGVFSY